MLENLIQELHRRRVITETGCWEIDNLPDSSGHVQIKYDGIAYLIHRLSAAFYLGLELENKKQLACHKNECHNPKCWNPDHLYVGTQKLNVNDAIELGTHFNRGENQRLKRLNKTHCPKGHPHTKKGSCHECNKIRCREFMRNKRKGVTI